MLIIIQIRRFTLIKPMILSGFFILFSSIQAEEPIEALKKVNDQIGLIKQASKTFNINYKTLSAIIYTERVLNYDWRDDALDVIIAESGLNSSIGFCQIKMKTAFWMEVQLNKPENTHAPGKEFEAKLYISKNPSEIITKLSNDSINIFYAAAYIRIIQSRWDKAGFSIDGKPDIIGTLYSTGLFYRDGNERKPRYNPVANEFGEKVKASMNLFQ
jgi:hypothetical protein